MARLAISRAVNTRVTRILIGTPRGWCLRTRPRGGFSAAPVGRSLVSVEGGRVAGAVLDHRDLPERKCAVTRRLRAAGAVRPRWSSCHLRDQKTVEASLAPFLLRPPDRGSSPLRARC